MGQVEVQTKGHQPSLQGELLHPTQEDKSQLRTEFQSFRFPTVCNNALSILNSTLLKTSQLGSCQESTDGDRPRDPVI